MFHTTLILAAYSLSNAKSFLELAQFNVALVKTANALTQEIRLLWTDFRQDVTSFLPTSCLSRRNYCIMSYQRHVSLPSFLLEFERFRFGSSHFN